MEFNQSNSYYNKAIHPNLPKNWEELIKNFTIAEPQTRVSSTEFWIDGVVLTTIALFGIIGTLMSIRVLITPQLKNNAFSGLLVYLAICDANFLLFAVLTIGLPDLSLWYTKKIFPYLLQITYGFMGIARTGSVYMTMAITLERYFAIVKPLESFKCKKALGPLTVAFAIAWNIPRFFEWKIVRQKNEEMYASKDNWEDFEIHQSEFRKGIHYDLYYRVWLTFIIIEAIPYLKIIILNAMILRKIVKSYTFRRSFTTRAREACHAEVGGHLLSNEREKEEHKMTTFRSNSYAGENINGSNVLEKNGKLISNEHTEDTSVRHGNTGLSASFHQKGYITYPKTHEVKDRLKLLQDDSIKCPLSQKLFDSSEGDITERTPLKSCKSESCDTSSEVKNADEEDKEKDVHQNSGSDIIPLTIDVQEDVIEVHEEGPCLEEAEKASNEVDDENESVLMRIILPQRSSLRISEPSKGDDSSNIDSTAINSTTTNTSFVPHNCLDGRHGPHGSLDGRHDNVPDPNFADSRQERSLGITIVAISVLFVICQSVKMVPTFYEIFLCNPEVQRMYYNEGEQEVCKSTKLIETFISFANLLPCVNSAANFLVYMLRGEKFRKAFLHNYKRYFLSFLPFVRSCRSTTGSTVGSQTLSCRGMHTTLTNVEHIKDDSPVLYHRNTLV